MMDGRKRVRDKIKGYRTLVWTIVCFTIDTLQGTNLLPIIPPALQPVWLIAQPLVFGYLRLITSSEVPIIAWLRGERENTQ